MNPALNGIPSYTPQLYLTYVPEPVSLSVLAVGLLGLGMARRRR